MSDPRPPSASTDERDAWLSQALRHAPDAAVTPSNALREAILAEARSAVRPLGSPTLPPKRAARETFAEQLAVFWSWLARPPVAAGFAGVMAATLVGLMWWDQPMDDAAAPAPMRQAQPEATAQPPAAPAAAAPIAADNSASPGPAVALPAAIAPTLPNVAPARREKAQPAKPTPIGGSEQSRGKDAAPSPALQTPPSTSPFPGQEPSPSESAMRKERAAPESAKKAESEAVAAASIPRRSRSDAADAVESRAAAPPQAFAPAPGPANATDSAAADAPATVGSTSARPMTTLLAALSRDPERWTRPLASGEALPLDAATQAWLASIDAVTAGRWQATHDRQALLEGAAAGDPSSLLLNRDGRAAGIVRVEDGGVTFELSPGTAWFAPLSGAAVARLRASLPPARR